MTPAATFIFLYATAAAAPQDTGAALIVEEGRRIEAVRTAEAIAIDGVLSEAVWSSAPPATSFAQREPNEGQPASEKTEVRFAYDDEALYVAARLFDSQPKSIVARLGRRDAWLQADAFEVFLDAYKDGRSGLFFSVNAAGTLRDGTLFNDDWDDDTWDGIWEGRARIDERGWAVEMRIPYSELRFHAKDVQSWGVNCRRYMARTKEDAYIAPRPKKASGFVSRFSELAGISGIHPPARVSITPYVTAKAEFMGHDAGDPFNDGSRQSSALGADAKIGLGSSLTLDATLNPDFGQVEVDPAVVNLSDVETFYSEKRPFFIEGSSLFQFGSGGASNYIGFNFPSPDFFYSRRIGRAPQGSLPDADFTQSPAGTTILGAAKLTGKLGQHWSVGGLSALTGRESAQLANPGRTSKIETEPASYYGVFRTQREFPDNRYGVGLITTVAKRFFEDQRLANEINRQALGFGVDGWAFVDQKKTWVLTGWAGVTQVKGSQASMLELQQNSQHYFQRPDAKQVRLDPGATSLSGTSARFAVNKERGNVLFNAAYGYIGPGYDTNDLGFLFRADLKNAHVWTGYRWTDPGRLARSADIEIAAFRTYDFDGNKTGDGLFAFGSIQFLDYHRLQGFVAHNPQSVSTHRTRGGPRTLNPPGWEWDLLARSDDRRAFRASLGAHGSDYELASDQYHDVSASLEWRPGSSVNLSVEPRLSWSHTDAQYVGTFDDALAAATYGHRYVFARLDQRSFSGGFRMNWTFTPRLSVQVYAQPLISSGEYSAFGELARPMSYDFNRYDAVSVAEGTVTADPDGAGPAPALAFDDPSFNFRSLRGNAVVRWEFRPGSTAYFVWTQNRSDEEDQGAFRFSHSFDRLLSAKADNILLVKVAFRWAK
jgi:hypothetical protein